MYLNALKTLHARHLRMHLQTLHSGGIIQKILVTQWLVQLAVRSSVQPLPRSRSSVHSVEGTNLNCFTACSCYSHCCSNSTGFFYYFFFLFRTSSEYESCSILAAACCLLASSNHKNPSFFIDVDMGLTCFCFWRRCKLKWAEKSAWNFSETTNLLSIQFNDILYKGGTLNKIK